MVKSELTIIFDSSDEMRAYLWIVEYYRRRFKCSENEVWLIVQNEIMKGELPVDTIERPMKRRKKKQLEEEDDSRFES